MKNKKLIEKLTQQAPSVPFPAPEPRTWTNFPQEIRGVLAENCYGLDTREVAWDQYEQVFSWVEERDLDRDFDNEMFMVAKKRFSLDPRKPIADEIERIRAERKAFNQAVMDAGRAIYRAQVRAEKQATAEVQS